MLHDGYTTNHYDYGKTQECKRGKDGDKTKRQYNHDFNNYGSVETQTHTHTNTATHMPSDTQSVSLTHMYTLNTGTNANRT